MFGYVQLSLSAERDGRPWRYVLRVVGRYETSARYATRLSCRFSAATAARRQRCDELCRVGSISLALVFVVTGVVSCRAVFPEHVMRVTDAIRTTQ